MKSLAVYRAHYGPVPPDETWFGFIALLNRIPSVSARKMLEQIACLRIAVGPMVNEANRMDSLFAKNDLEKLAIDG